MQNVTYRQIFFLPSLVRNLHGNIQGEIFLCSRVGGMTQVSFVHVIRVSLYGRVTQLASWHTQVEMNNNDAMAVARGDSTSRSLLSRIAPPNASNEQADRSALRKRGVPEETYSRSNKRRRGTDGCNSFDRRRAPWLTSTVNLETKVTREEW